MTWATPITSIAIAVPAFMSISNSPLTANGTVTLGYSGVALPVANGGTGVTTSTGSGNLVLSNTPTFTTPVLGAATGTSLNLSGLTASQAIFTDGSKNLVSVAVTGSGNSVRATGPSIIDAVLTGNLSIGGGTSLKKHVRYIPSLTPVAVAANTSAEQTFTVSGLLGSGFDVVIVNGPAPTAGTGIVNVRVSADNTLAITFANFTAGSLTPAAGNYNLVAFANGP